MRRARPIVALLLCLIPAGARQEQSACGTHHDKLHEELHLHRRSARAALRPVRKLASGDVLSDAGNIAVLGDTDGVVARRNPFSLNQRTLRFLPAGAGYRYETGADSYDDSLHGPLLDRLGDDDTREVALPFSFPFYGAVWTSVHINSDGNLTFGAGDDGITERSLGKVTAGPPRIAALFRDLDPTRSRDGVRVLSESDRFVVSWVEVPEYQDTGTGPLQKFQIRLFPDGRIEFAYSRISTRDAVVGIAPGRLSAPTSVVAFNTPSESAYPGAIVERFTSSEEIDLFAAAQKFYLTHEDSYDYLVIFNTLGIAASPGAVAFQVPVRNNRSGYGDPKIDDGPVAGSGRRLQTMLNMGPLSQYPLDPYAVVPARITSGDTPMTVLAHEAGHLFAAYASVRDVNNPDARPMLGRDMFHWAFTLNTDASVMEGNRIVDNGESASPRFSTTAAVQRYSALDQYLMGLIAPSEVPDTFLVERAGVSASRAPETGVRFNGVRRNIRIDEIIASEGRRVPDHTVAQRRFRFAFVLVAASGNPPTPAQIAQLDRYRTEFEGFFNIATGGRATADTSLRNTLYVSAFPAAGVIEGRSITMQVTTDRLVEAPLTILVRRRTAIVDAPASITIPAGGGEARFTLSGIRQGVEELVFEPSDDRWETVEARVQISPPRSLRMQFISGGERFTIRVTDSNDLPYPNVAIRALWNGGSMIAGETDSNGIARLFRPAGATGTLLLSVDGGPAITVVP